ncbi:hypothetical protein PMAYCL1PPCAC_02728, partial [Pristionchus mayeri]
DRQIEGTHSVGSDCCHKSRHDISSRRHSLSRFPFGRSLPLRCTTYIKSLNQREKTLLIVALRARTRRDDIDEDKEKNPFHTYLSSAAHDTAEGVE